MIDLDLLRHQPEVVKESLRRRHMDDAVVDRITTSDTSRRALLTQLENLQAESNRLTKTKDLAEQNMAQLKDLKAKIVELKKNLDQHQTDAELQQIHSLPNLLLADVPDGSSAKDDQVLAEVGEIKLRTGLPHEELMTKERQNWLDLVTPAKFSGSRYRYLKNEAAIAQQQLLRQAIIFALSKGFQFVIPPVVSRQHTLEATGFFPNGQDDTFKLEDDQYLIGTSEPMLLALAADQEITEPLRYVGISTCFRREAGSYGKDVKGMFRMHQFDKVEMVSVTHPDDSEREHQALVAIQEEFVQKFALPYQKMLLCSGEQSQIAAKQIDLNTWFPSQERYRETHSASNCTDYQARDLKIKFQRDGKTVLAHTLNATLATERLLLAIIENNQHSDGSVSLPVSLQF